MGVSISTEKSKSVVKKVSTKQKNMTSLKKAQMGSPSIKLYNGNNSKSQDGGLRRINLANSTPAKTTAKSKLLKSKTPKKNTSAIVDLKNEKKEPQTLKKRKTKPMVDEFQEELKVE